VVPSTRRVTHSPKAFFELLVEVLAVVVVGVAERHVRVDDEALEPAVGATHEASLLGDGVLQVPVDLHGSPPSSSSRSWSSSSVRMPMYLS